MSKRLLMMLVGSKPPEINEVCPAMTPTWSETTLVTNGNMEIGDPPIGWSGGILATYPEERTGGSGLQSLKVTTVNWSSAIQSITPSAGAWLKVDGWGKRGSYDSLISILGSSIPRNNWYTSSTTWGKIVFECFIIGTTIQVNCSNNNEKYSYFDDVNVYEMNFSSMHTLLGDRKRKNGTYICRPTIDVVSDGGMLIEYKDENNFVLVDINRVSFVDIQARLVSKINGVYAVANANAITYAAKKELMCVVDGTTHQLFYDGTQVGTDVTIDNSTMGSEVHGFVSRSTNSVGLVTTNPT